MIFFFFAYQKGFSTLNTAFGVGWGFFSLLGWLVGVFLQEMSPFTRKLAKG